MGLVGSARDLVGNTVVATAPSTTLNFGAMRVRDGTGVTIAKNVATGPWQNGVALADIAASRVEHNHLAGALAYGIRARAGGSALAVSITGNLFSTNQVTGAGAAGIFLTSACNNTLLGNDVQGNAGNVGAIFDGPTGANVVVGNVTAVIDNGSFDCDGDGVPDANIITGPGRVLHGPFSPAPSNAAGSTGKFQ